MSEQILKVNELKAYYGDFQALFNISLNVKRGEVVAIIGANGAGKTTLLRSISGLLNQEPEMIKYCDVPIGNLRADQIVKMGVALVPEGRQLFPSLSVEENLVIGGHCARSGDWNLKRLYDVFPILEEKKSLPATELSGGQQQMVAIGRALMSNPDLLLFDEVSLGLAPIVIKSIYEMLPKIVGDDLSVVIVEQDVSQAKSVSDRVYCMHEGEISLEGNSNELSKEQIYNAYFGV